MAAARTCRYALRGMDAAPARLSLFLFSLVLTEGKSRSPSWRYPNSFVPTAARSHLGAAVVNDLVISFSGYDPIMNYEISSNMLLVFDLKNKQVVYPDGYWGLQPCLRQGYAMASVNSTIVLHGGSHQGNFSIDDGHVLTMCLT
eukprot:756407-Hanusia_phi.AAC.2